MTDATAASSDNVIAMALSPLVHETFHSHPVEPGRTVQIITRPQRCDLFKPLFLTVDPACAPHFDIDDVTIGMRSQTPQAQRVAAACYLERTPWICDTIMLAMDFIMVVTNRSDKPMHFCATWLCATTEHDQAALQVERDELYRALDAAHEALREAQKELRHARASCAAQHERCLQTMDPHRRMSADEVRELLGSWQQIVGAPRFDQLAAETAAIDPVQTPIEAPESRIGHVRALTRRPELERREPGGFGWDPYGA